MPFFFQIGFNSIKALVMTPAASSRCSSLKVVMYVFSAMKNIMIVGTHHYDVNLDFHIISKYVLLKILLGIILLK